MDDGTAITLGSTVGGLLGSTLLCALVYAWEKRKYPGDYFTRHFPDAAEPEPESLSPDDLARVATDVFGTHEKVQ